MMKLSLLLLPTFATAINIFDVRHYRNLQITGDECDAEFISFENCLSVNEEACLNDNEPSICTTEMMDPDLDPGENICDGLLEDLFCELAVECCEGLCKNTAQAAYQCLAKAFFECNGLGETCSGGGGGGGGGTCFSATSTVKVLGHGPVQMKDLQVGDQVPTGQDSSYEPIYAFAHMDKTSKAEFVQIQMEQGNAMEASGAHLVFVDGKAAPVRADSIKVGDVLQGAAVTKIKSVQRTGLYAPLTANGKIVVDGVLSSNYVSLEKAASHAFLGQNVHGFSHLAMSPFRLLCSTASFGMCTSYTEEGVPAVLDAGHSVYEWLMDLPTVFQAIVLGAFLVFASMVWALECVLLNPVVSLMVVTSIAGFLIATKGTSMHIQATKAKSL